MGNRGGILATAAALALLTACSTPAPAPVAQTTASPAPTTTKPVPTSDAPALGPGPGSQPKTTPQPPPPNSPAEITSACPFLGVTDISDAMGAALNSHAVEAEPNREFKPPVYRCDYVARAGGGQVHEMYVAAVPGTGRLETKLKDWTQDCAGPAVPVAGAPGTARTCALTGAKQGDVMLLVAKQVHGQTRMAELDLRPNRNEVYVRLAQLLTDRL
jgi:hypothetical protein